MLRVSSKTSYCTSQWYSIPTKIKNNFKLLNKFKKMVLIFSYYFDIIIYLSYVE